MTEFRDAIANVLDNVPMHEDHGFDFHDQSEQADAVLAMPEMEAVRTALREVLVLLDTIAPQYWVPEVYDAFDLLPESARAWVLGEDR